MHSDPTVFGLREVCCTGWSVSNRRAGGVHAGCVTSCLYEEDELCVCVCVCVCVNSDVKRETLNVDVER